MQTATLMSVFVLSAVVLLTAPPPADAECCHPNHRFKCEDGSRGSPYCGISECNALGCDCDGGCRQAQHKRNNPDGSVVGADSHEGYFQGGSYDKEN